MSLRIGIAAAAALLTTALFAAGCGDDDGDSSESTSVAIEATGGGSLPRFTTPAEVPAGIAEIELTNSTDQDDVDAQLIHTPGDQPEADVLHEFAAVVVGRPVADWFQAGGGVGPIPAGETRSVTQELKEGTYFVLGGEDPRPPLTKITVTAGDDGGELPETDGVVTASEYEFTAEGLKAGSNPVLLENAGSDWHHFLASRLAPGATIEEAETYLKTRFGPSPFTGADGADSAVLEGGTSQVVELELESGTYAFYCAISDRAGGEPHFAKGMVSEVVVE